jgi:pantetheine-phosphate adenylyltransferase
MKALYAGSFDPITNGHIDIILQAYDIFDVVAIGIAVNPDKKYLFTDDAREKLVFESLKALDGEILTRTEIYQYSGMTVEYAKRIGANVLVRGLRAVSDFDSEFQMVQFNRRLPPGCNTVFLMPDEKNFYLSSTAVRGIAKMGGDVSPFVPACVATACSNLPRK